MKKIFLLLMLIAALIGCSVGEAASDKEQQEAEQAEAEMVAAVTKQEILEADLGKMNHLQLLNGICYYTRYEKSADGENILLYLCRQDTDGQEEIVFTYRADAEEQFYMRNSCCDSNGSWYNLYSRDEQGKTIIYLEKLDSYGETVFSRQLEEYEDIILSENCLDAAVSSEGCFYLLTAMGTLLAWNQEGDETGCIKADAEESGAEWKTSGLVNGGETGVYLYHTALGKVSFNRIDLSSMTLEKSVEADISAAAGDRSNLSGTAAYETASVYGGYTGSCYLAGEESLFIYSFEKKEVQKLFNWEDSYVNIDRHQLKAIGNKDGRYIFLCYDPTLGTSNYLVVEEKKQEELSSKTLITLGCADWVADMIKELVKRYNSQSSQYQIELKGYDTGSGQTQLDELTIALLQGEGPDIINLNGMSMDYYASKGVMEDLVPYLEASGIKLVGQVENALCSKDGEIYAFSSGFTIQGYAVPFGYETDGGFSIRQCMDLQNDNPQSSMLKNNNRISMLYAMMIADMDTYIDFDAGTCSFTEEAFIRLLNWVNTWKEPQYDTSQYVTTLDELSEKQYLITPVTITSMADYLIYQDIFAGNYTVAGFPNYQGEPKYRLMFTNFYAINSASENKEGAWDFLLYLLSDYEQEKAGCFPVTQEAFEKAVQTGQDENYIRRDIYSGKTFGYLWPEQKDIDAIWEIMDHLYYIDESPQVILKIIIEESNEVFNGEKTAEQAAEIIQKRVSLFLQE